MCELFDEAQILDRDVQNILKFCKLLAWIIW